MVVNQNKVSMKNKLILVGLAVLSMTFLSCEDDFNDHIIEVLGVYDANVVGLTPIFDMSVSSIQGDDIAIEALFDGEVWSVVEADIDGVENFVKDIDIRRQVLGPGVEIWGDGFYSDRTIQLNYTMKFGSELFDFVIIGSK